VDLQISSPINMIPWWRSGRRYKNPPEN